MVNAHQPLAPRTETNTVWFNPLDQEQHVDVKYGDESRVTRFTFPPKSRTSVPSRFDSAIHLRVCGEDSCRKGPTGFCNDKTHRATVLGGLAPQLRMDGCAAQIAPVLIPDVAEQMELERELGEAKRHGMTDTKAARLAAARLAELEEQNKALDLGPAIPAHSNPIHAPIVTMSDAELDEATKPAPKTKNRPQ